MPMANRHGWELVCPTDVTAKWDGGPHPQNVQVKCREPWDVAGHFGTGYLTFNMAGLFQLSEGWNLWVTGPPNHCKPGAYPMTGLVEWDWLPYIATMNYQLTDPGRAVQWRKGEPYAFVMPVRRGDVESFDARMELLEDHPQVKAQHDAWAADRNRRVQEARSGQLRPHEQNGFLYAKGQLPDGSRCPVQHQTSLKVSPFAQGS
jgi:hypothetical protein